MARSSSDVWWIDTNILVYASLPHHPLHSAAVARLTALEVVGADRWVSRQTLREYLAAMTRPGVYTGKLPLPDVVANVRRFESSFLVAEDTAAVTARLLTLVSTINVGGKQVHDANIVATMSEHAVPNLLTHNIADFARFSGMITIVPLVP